MGRVARALDGRRAVLRPWTALECLLNSVGRGIHHRLLLQAVARLVLQPRGMLNFAGKRVKICEYERLILGARFLTASDPDGAIRLRALATAVAEDLADSNSRRRARRPLRGRLRSPFLAPARAIGESRRRGERQFGDVRNATAAGGALLGPLSAGAP
jgi:hypothetical protein